MRMSDVHDYARQMLDAYGDKAEPMAQQRAVKAESAGNEAEAETWRRVRAALKEMRGSHVS